MGSQAGAWEPVEMIVREVAVGVMGRQIEARGLDTCLRRYDKCGVWRG